jgi:hypothetical protein
MVRGALCILGAVCLVAPVVVWLLSTGPVPPNERERLAQAFILPIYCNPEPGEQRAFLGSIVLLPAGILGLAALSQRGQFRFFPPRAQAVRWVVELVLAVLLLGLAWFCLRPDDFFEVRQNLFVKHPFGTLPLFAATVAVVALDLGKMRLFRPITHLLALAAIGIVFLTCLTGDTGAYAQSPHFNAMFFSSVQVAQGKTLLLDCLNQYGLYSQFLQPVFALIGLSVLKFTVVMGLLLALSYAALGTFLRQACTNRSVALFGFLALVFCGWSCFITYAQFDLYFQYLPIRFVFPALLVLIAWRYFRRPGRALYWGGLLTLSAGVLWNLDSGLPTFMTWLCTLGYAEFLANDFRNGLKKSLKHLAAGSVALAGVLICYAAGVYFRSGAVPDFGQLFYFQRLFYAAGFTKTPLQLPGTWALVTLTYLAGLTHAAFALLTRKDSLRAKSVFLLSVLGIGLFSYYQAHPHHMVLLLVWWPVFPLLTLFLDELIDRVRDRQDCLFPWAVAGLIAWLLIGSACSFFPQVPLFARTIAANYQAFRPRSQLLGLKPETEVLKTHVAHGEKVFLASAADGLLHLTSSLPTHWPCSFAQMLLVEDYRALTRMLDDEPTTKVYVDGTIFGLQGWYKDHEGAKLLIAFLQNHYCLVASTPRGYLFERCPEDEAFPGECREEPLVWFRSREGTIGDGIALRPISLGPSLTVELLLQPAEAQVANAAVIGNHPGAGVEGFVLMAESPGVYVLLAGDGQNWHRLLDFPLEANAWSHLALVRQGTTIRVYVNGRLAATSAATGGTIKDSPLSLHVGNWYRGDRPFHGRIKEVKVLNRALAPSEIFQRADCLRNRLSHPP